MFLMYRNGIINMSKVQCVKLLTPEDDGHPDYEVIFIFDDTVEYRDAISVSFDLKEDFYEHLKEIFLSLRTDTSPYFDSVAIDFC